MGAETGEASGKIAGECQGENVNDINDARATLLVEEKQRESRPD
jgi:hypothetical protein